MLAAFIAARFPADNALALQKKGKAKQPLGTKATATPVELIKVKKDFKVELLYSVPRDTQGSWVSMTVDDQGRLIASDQGGRGIYRITPPPIGGKSEDTRVER